MVSGLSLHSHLDPPFIEFKDGHMSQLHPIQNDAIMFITTNTHRMRPVFRQDPYALEAVETLYCAQALRPFFLYAFVIMPDHCHFLLEVPEGGSISSIMNSFWQLYT